MLDTNKVIENFDISSPQRADRKLVLKNWGEQQGQDSAEKEGIELTEKHWKIVHCLREYYLEHGPAQNGRELGDMLNSEFADKGGRKYLHRLFAKGPVAQGMRIAGLNVPPHTEDSGFGTSR